MFDSIHKNHYMPNVSRRNLKGQQSNNSRSAELHIWEVLKLTDSLHAFKHIKLFIGEPFRKVMHKREWRPIPQ